MPGPEDPAARRRAQLAAAARRCRLKRQTEPVELRKANKTLRAEIAGLVDQVRIAEGAVAREEARLREESAANDGENASEHIAGLADIPKDQVMSDVAFIDAAKRIPLPRTMLSGCSRNLMQEALEACRFECLRLLASPHLFRRSAFLRNQPGVSIKCMHGFQENGKLLIRLDKTIDAKLVSNPVSAMRSLVSALSNGDLRRTLKIERPDKIRAEIVPEMSWTEFDDEYRMIDMKIGQGNSTRVLVTRHDDIALSSLFPSKRARGVVDTRVVLMSSSVSTSDILNTMSRQGWWIWQDLDQAVLHVCFVGVFAPGYEVVYPNLTVQKAAARNPGFNVDLVESLTEALMRMWRGSTLLVGE